MTRSLSLIVTLAFLALIGCHADPDDPVGQAEELKDPIRRALAVSNLQNIYTRALDQREGDREHPDVKRVADAIAEPLSQAYIDYPENTRLGKLMLDIMKEMRDPRTLPALLKALQWRQGVTEEHAIRAAQTLQYMQVPEAQKGEVIERLSAALDQVSGSRGLDNQLRRELIIALGGFEDRRAAPALMRVVSRQSEEQDFLFNRLAAQQLARLSDPGSLNVFLHALFVFSPRNPAMRMNDVATEGLVRIGRPAYEPLLVVLRGQNEEINALAAAYIEAIRARDPEAADQMSIPLVVGQEATYALGALGFRDALEPLLEETRSDDPFRKFNASLALVRLNLLESDYATVREALSRVFGEMPEGIQGARLQLQLIAVMRQLYDAELLPFFKGIVFQEDIVPDLRIEAAQAYALLADRDAVNAVRRCAQDDASCEPGGETYLPFFDSNAVLLDASVECHQSIECWVGKLDASDPALVRKAAFMLGRFGRGNDQAIQALVNKLAHEEIEVRFASLAALDRIAVNGAPQAVELIDRLQREEEGRRIWTLFSSQALPSQARLRVRAGNAG